MIIMAVSQNLSCSSHILKLKDITQRCSISKSKIYRDIKEGRFPKQVHLGSNCVGWLSYDIDNWIGSLTQTIK